MDTNNLVSVIIPAYNHEKYIQETIESIINQTYQNIELIILDDGSKDSTWEKIQELKDKCEKRFARIHFETKENEGTCKTLNKLISLSEGEFIYLIASDDVAKPNAIELELDFLRNNQDYALCVGDNEYIDINSNSCIKDGSKTFAESYQKIKGFKLTDEKFGTYNTIYTGNYIPNGYLIRKSIFKKVDLFTPEAPLEDYYLMMQIAKYSKMKFINRVLFSYRIHQTNTMKNLEKVHFMNQKTLEYENKLLENINFSGLNKDVYETFIKGGLYKHIKIPFIYEYIKYKKFNKETKKLESKVNVKIFGITIYKK